ncbi:preprotein translocase subunit SecA [Candidatus Giovannonibacteria bacterium RIFCSPHIGHO2_12_FULL_44_42]|nr:MAG: preprotein translocase subunit SecA [Candidatus Giovannonibacteria bacterium RIFCSPHIGHO2_12_FULL_44_42]OGF88987.1 MAG: preprotein translocase subunit SecA [Candidatus Giovannonibacteria bacterium RIFCSPLOWO2_02_FULL_43_54]OGF97423.1 MAG: preprotein translocase subunit SecA [Candidatus Giovannonibacteria bacterium RIFCSPLOWO2_12_FULL_44_32]
MMSFLGKIFGGLGSNEGVIEELKPIVEQINALEPEFKKLSDAKLKAKTLEFRKRLGEGETLDDILPEAFAAVREASKRTLGQRHYDSQLIGGMVMHRGQIAEMKTGEGKTLVATLPMYLNALSGDGAHLITVNDYLARRDATWMGQIYNALGLSVGALNHEVSYLYDASAVSVADDKNEDTLGAFKIVHEFLRPCSRSEAYGADITYGTNNEYGFDYLRDNMVYAPSQLSQRQGVHHFAIVDEVDSILIDEARTPLIISAPDTESGELYKTFAKIAPRLKEGADYNVDEKMKAVSITEEGIEKVENILGVKDIYTEKGIKYVHHLEQALRAQALFFLDKDYVVKNGEVIIVDEFTGRLMPGRRWSEGLHQAIEAKEGVTVQKESRTLATITFQNYFRLYEKLAGMTGTAQTSAEEFHKVYKLEVVSVPTNRPMQRRDLPDKIFQSEKGKFTAIAREVRAMHEKGQPVLIGTVSIEKNERLAAILGREGIPHKILNAKNHEAEAEIIAQAGRLGGVTVATNMAGRGVDIILGGNPPNLKEAEKVREAGGLAVIGTERHEARRIDNQLRGRAGRQGDPGASQFYVSMEDDLMRIFGSDRIKNMMGRFGIPEDEAIENKMVSNAIESAQEKIEGYNFDSRKHVLEYDDVMNKQRKAIYGRRFEILFGKAEEIEEKAKIILTDVLAKIVEVHTISELAEEWNREEIEENIKAIFGDINSIHEAFHKAESREDLTDLLNKYLEDSFLKKKESVGEFAEAVRMTMLRAIDVLWMEHLEAMEYMRGSVRLRAYGQRDPLIEYKNEGAKMFQQLEGHINAYIANLIFKIGPSAGMSTTPIQNQGLKLNLNNGSKNFQHSVSNKKGEIGRNDPCPCGSGKKYKRCHGR